MVLMSNYGTLITWFFIISQIEYPINLTGFMTFTKLWSILNNLGWMMNMYSMFILLSYIYN